MTRNLDYLVASVVHDNPNGLRHSEIVQQVLRRGYTHDEPGQSLSEGVYASVKKLVKRGVIVRHEEQEGAARQYKPSKGRKRCILVVDDCVDTANSLAFILHRAGHKVYTAYDGPSAVEQFMNIQPDVVFLDLRLPGMSGHEVAQLLRDRSFGGSLIALTAYRDEEEQSKQEEVFDNHILKPVDPRHIEQLAAC